MYSMARTCTYSHPFWRLVTVGMLAVLATCAAPAIVVTAAAPATNMSLVVRGPSAVGVDALFNEKVIVTNHGTAPASGITVSYSTGGPSISPSAAAGMVCVVVERGHSGRGGGYTIVGDSCSESVAAGLLPGHSITVTLAMTELSVEDLTLAFTVSTYPAAAQLNDVSHTATVPVLDVRPPAAAAATHVKATQSNDQLNVTWKPAFATAAYISASQIIATPVSGSVAPVLTGSVSGAATRGVVQGLLASTTYSITVTNNDGGGAGASSRPLLFKTHRATIPPAAPAITYAWGYADVRWSAPSGRQQRDRHLRSSGHRWRSEDRVLRVRVDTLRLPVAPAHGQLDCEGQGPQRRRLGPLVDVRRLHRRRWRPFGSRVR